MSYIIFSSVILIGIITMIVSYILTPDVKPIKKSNKLEDNDVSIKDAIKELKLVNEIENT